MVIWVVGALVAGLLGGAVAGLVLGTRMFHRGVARGRAEAVEMLEVSISSLAKRVDDRAAAKAAAAPADFQYRTAEEVCEWAESVVRLWKTLRQSP